MTPVRGAMAAVVVVVASVLVSGCNQTARPSPAAVSTLAGGTLLD